MPFPDETGPVEVVAYRIDWPHEFIRIKEALNPVASALAAQVDHIGSIAVPGLPAKDMIDLQLRVDRVDEALIATALTRLGYRQRAEPWNTSEETRGEVWPKMAFAAPLGHRRVNVHVRLARSAGAREALLFRDYLRAHADQRDAWGAFKTRAAAEVHDLNAYGQIKHHPWTILMRAADDWATRIHWNLETGFRHGDH